MFPNYIFLFRTSVEYFQRTIFISMFLMEIFVYVDFYVSNRRFFECIFPNYTLPSHWGMESNISADP